MNRTRTKATAVAIPVEMRDEVLRAVESFNRHEIEEGQCYYEARFSGTYCYLSRVDYGRGAPICRLQYKGREGGWEFAIFKWSTEQYDPDEWMFPGSHLVDGTVEGAMRAGLEAYPV
jgi:hypothetical protein